MEVVRQKNVSTYITFPIVDADGDFVTGAAGLDSEIDTFADGTAPDGFTDCTNESSEIGSTGIYKLQLTQAEMNFDYIVIQVKTSTSGAKTQMILIRTMVGDVLNIATTDDGGTINVDSGKVDAQVKGLDAGTITAAAIATGAIDADAIADNAIDAGAIADGSFTAVKFADNFLTAAKIATDAIDADAIAAGAIDAGAIASNAISAAKIATGAITSAKFATGAIDAAAIAAGAIDADALATDAVNEIADGVWDEATAGHTTAGSTGKALIDIGTAVVEPIDANITQIGGNSITGNLATLTLKQLDIQNSAGSALIAKSTGGNGIGVDIAGNGTGDGLKTIGGATSGNGIHAEGNNSGFTSACGILAKGNGATADKAHGISGESEAQAGHGISGKGTGSSGYGINGQSTDNQALNLSGKWGAHITGTDYEGVKIVGNLDGLRVEGKLDGIHAEATEAANNGSGAHLVGVGAGAGMKNVAGATGNGQENIAGMTSGNGMDNSSVDGHGTYSHVSPTGHGDGIRSLGGLTGNGVYNIAGSGTGAGMKNEASTLGHGQNNIGGSNSGDGIHATGNNASGIKAESLAGGHGVYAVAPAAASSELHGIYAVGAGGSDSDGCGIRAEALADGHGIYAKAGSGGGDGLRLEKGVTGGQDINADEIGTPANLGEGASLAANLHSLANKVNGGSGYDQTTDSLEAIRDRGDAAWGTSVPPSGQDIRDAMMLSPSTSASPAIGSIDANINSILLDTGTSLPADIAALPTDADVQTAAAAAITAASLATAANLAVVDGIVDDILVDTGTTIPAAIAALPTDADVQAAADAAITANTDINNIDSGVNNIEAKLPAGDIADEDTVVAVGVAVAAAAGDITELLSRMGVPVALDGGSATIAGMVLKMADDNDGVDFNAGSDSAHALRLRLNELLSASDTVDGITVSLLLEYLMAMANGNFAVNVPAAGYVTFYKRDGATPLFVVQITTGGRTRI